MQKLLTWNLRVVLKIRHYRWTRSPKQERLFNFMSNRRYISEFLDHILFTVAAANFTRVQKHYLRLITTAMLINQHPRF